MFQLFFAYFIGGWQRAELAGLVESDAKDPGGEFAAAIESRGLVPDDIHGLIDYVFSGAGIPQYPGCEPIELPEIQAIQFLESRLVPLPDPLDQRQFKVMFH